MNNTLLLLVFGIIVITIPVFIVDTFGYSFVGVTSNGVEFPIISSIQDNTGIENATSILDGLGVYMTIQNIGSNGVVYFGEGDNPGSQTDIRAYVEVNDTDDWVVVIDDDDYTEVLVVPEFGKEYEYVSGVVPSIVDVTKNIPNILGYSTSKIISGTPYTSINNDGITISGTGKILLKLNDYDGYIIIRGAPSNAVLSIVNSLLELIPLAMSGSDFIIYDNPSAIFQVLSHTHVNEGCGSHRCGSPESGIRHYFDFQITSTPNITIAEDSPLSVTQSATITSSLVADGLLISQLQNQQSMSVKGTNTVPTPSTLHKITSVSPYNVISSFTDNFEQVMILPYNSYLVVTVNGEPVTIKGETFDPQLDIFFQVDGLPVDTAYDISKSGITGIVGKTSNTGGISLLYNDVDFGIGTSPGGILKIYPNSTKYLGNLGIVMIDVLHDSTVQLPVGEDLVYIPQNYVYWVFPVPIEVENVSVDNISLHYLNKNYTKNEALYIPVIPSGNTIHVTINGENVEVLMRDVSSSTQIKQVPKESSTTSNHSISGAVSATSNVSTGTFLTATHTGMMYVNLDFKVGGSVDFSMDSQYTGGFTKSTSCKWHGASSPSRTFSCHSNSTPSNPDSITNMVSLTAEHQTQLIAALHNGQVSNITVEVDILKNMGTNNDAQTILLYTSNSAQASVSSTLSEARYGATNQVRITYPLTSISENIAIPVIVGDMVEFVVRVNLDVAGAPTPSSEDASYSSYVSATTEFGGGIISVGMS